jgi:hypothetical protein
MNTHTTVLGEEVLQVTVLDAGAEARDVEVIAWVLTGIFATVLIGLR